MGDNARDRNAKGRAASKARTLNGRARLTERGVEVVRDMHAKGMTYRAIGAYLGLHETTVSYAVKGKHWA
jgi:DNA-binding NarL/FixJ family response regulator